MKFIFADSLDHVDPRFDFERDEYGDGRDTYWDDAYPHEVLGYAPHDGVLVSRAIVGDHRLSGKYSESQSMRFRRIGARAFLRLDEPKYADHLIFGDCGAFSYARDSVPPYTPQDTVEFYADGGFTHGCSIDHIIFEFDPNCQGLTGGTEDAHLRFDITLDLADAFFRESRQLGSRFTPIGVVQGWSPASMAEAARRLHAMGYHYIAIGGLVPLSTEAIHQAVGAVQEAVGNDPQVRLHLLGFAKADQLPEFLRYRSIASFDTTSPMIRAFKDARRNYYLSNGDGTLHYYTAIRIPQAIENPRLLREVKRGNLNQEALVCLERNALDAIRAYDRDNAGIEETLDSLVGYSMLLISAGAKSEASMLRESETLRSRYRATLIDRPWKQCECAVCKALSVEALIFRGSNRNKRRGIHNLAVFYRHLGLVLEK